MIYLDNNSTTQLDPRVLKAMVPYFTEIYANASSKHFAGIRSKQAITKARNQIAECLDCEERNIYFTSGATESLNWALKGFCESNQSKGKHILTCETEHSAVLETCKYLESIGFEISYLPVDENGQIDLIEYKSNLRSDTILTCLMYANNETGVVHPIKELVTIAHQNGTSFCSDMTQAVGKIPISIRELEVDFAALSAHKIHGPKGIGALYVKDFKQLSILLHGGGQENDQRSGSYNLPSIVGFGEALRIAFEDLDQNINHITMLQNYFESEVQLLNEDFKIHAVNSSRLCSTTSLAVPHLLAEVLIKKLEPVVISNGSACKSENLTPSHVLTAMGLSEDEASSTIRISYSRLNQIKDLKILIERLEAVCSQSNLIH